MEKINLELFDNIFYQVFMKMNIEHELSNRK